MVLISGGEVVPAVFTEVEVTPVVTVVVDSVATKDKQINFLRN